MIVVGYLLDLVNREFNLSVSSTHVFACECNPKLREWIRRFFKPQAVFIDVQDMGSLYAWDDMSQSPQKVGSCDLLIAGFVCKAISHLNIHAKKNKDCCALKRTDTGLTLNGIIAYCKAHHPAMGIFENVIMLAAKKQGTLMAGKNICNDDSREPSSIIDHPSYKPSMTSHTDHSQGQRSEPNMNYE